MPLVAGRHALPVVRIAEQCVLTLLVLLATLLFIAQGQTFPRVSVAKQATRAIRMAFAGGPTRPRSCALVGNGVADQTLDTVAVRIAGQPRFSVDATQGRTVFAKTNKSSLALGGMIAWVSIADRPNTLSAPAAVLTHQPGLAMDILGAKFSLADRG